MTKSTLKTYQKKRNVKESKEPKARIVRSSKEKFAIFVVQKHKASHLHYDFRLELDGVLVSWAVPKGPSMNPADKRLAMMVEDHPFDYKDFEGVIPEGNYGAGTVMVWDEGTYISMGATTRKESDQLMEAGLKKGHIDIVINGTKLKGEFALIKIKSSTNKKENSWLMIKKNDDYASEKDITRLDRSSSTGRTLKQITQEESDE